MSVRGYVCVCVCGCVYMCVCVLMRKEMRVELTPCVFLSCCLCYLLSQGLLLKLEFCLGSGLYPSDGGIISWPPCPPGFFMCTEDLHPNLHTNSIYFIHWVISLGPCSDTWLKGQSWRLVSVEEVYTYV